MCEQNKRREVDVQAKQISQTPSGSSDRGRQAANRRLISPGSFSLQMIGNAALLDHPNKVAFLSSRKISAADVLKCYEWAEVVRNTDRCIVSGFQSPLEKDVLKFLLRGKAPVILVLARKLWAKVPEELAGAVDAGRLLIVSPVKDARASAATAATRNRWILAHCSSLILGSLDPDGNLAKLVTAFPATRITCLSQICDNRSASPRQ